MLLSAGIFVWIEQRWSHWWVAVTQKKIDNLIAKHLSILPGDSFQPAIDGFIDTLTKDPGYIYNLNVSLPPLPTPPLQDWYVKYSDLFLLIFHHLK